LVQLQPDPPGTQGGVAQLGEHLLCKQGVIGSIPFTSTNDVVQRLEPSEWGKFAWFWFFETRGCSFFNNTEEVQPHHEEVLRGVAGFRLYVSPVSIEFDGGGSNTSAEVKKPVALDFGVSRLEGTRL
jgi:hypothetical protein